MPSNLPGDIFASNLFQNYLQGQLEVVKFLMTHVKEKEPRDKFGKTPLDRARQGGHQVIVDFIQNYENITPTETTTIKLTSWQPNYQKY